MRRPEAALAAALLLASAAPATDGPRTGRWHLVFGRGLEVSILFLRTQSGDETRLLVSAAAGRFLFLSRQDPTGNDSTESIQAMATGEVFGRRILLSEYDGVAGCGAVKTPDACLVWTGAKGSLTAGLSAFSGEGAKAACEKVAALVTEPMQRSLFALEPILPVLMEFGSYKGDFLGLVWPSHFNSAQSIRHGKRTAGCAFDTTFGYPCDEAEKERERRRYAE